MQIVKCIVLNFILFLQNAYADQVPTIPEKLAGLWKVDSVYTSQLNTSSHQLSKAIYRGAILNFSADGVDLVSTTCSNPNIEMKNEIFATVKSKINEIPLAKSFNEIFSYDFPEKEKADFLKIYCGEKSKIKIPFHTATFFKESWVALRQNGDLVVGLVGDGLYVAHRLAINEKMEASFNCSKASTFAEKTICNDNFLSNLDYRMAIVYKEKLKESLDFGKQCQKTLIKSQAEWIKKRNNCSDQVCLKTQMKIQLNFLGDRLLDSFEKDCRVDSL